MNDNIENFIINNRTIFNDLAHSYEAKAGTGIYGQYAKAKRFIEKHYTEDSDKLYKLIYKEVTRRNNNKLCKTLDHLGEMSIREFRSKIEALTDNKVCVNGGKAFLHIYNWLFVKGKKTRYRCHHYYISVGQNLARTEENAKMIADKCMKFAAIENYGQNEVIPVEKF